MTPQLWTIEYTPNGHKYTLYEKLTRHEAEGLLSLMKENDRLVLALRNSSAEERQRVEQEWQAVAQELSHTASLVFRRCLDLTQEQIDNTPTQECIAILVKVAKFSLE